MADLEELKRRKEQLELERDIARLEREARVGQAVSGGVDRVSERVDKIAKWSWMWVVPVTLLAVFAVILAFDKETVGHTLAAVLLLVPIFAKMIGKR